MMLQLGKACRLLLALFAMLVAAVPSAAIAADYAAGADLAGGSVTLWFRSAVGSGWVDAHYSVNGGPQQNVRMTYNSATTRFETTFSGSSGQVVRHSFTYDKAGLAYDSPIASTVVGSGGATVATPSFSVAGGTYAASQSVAITTSTPGATIRYTTDGSMPNQSSPVYGGAIVVSGNLTLKAYATASGMADSALASATYVINAGGAFSYSQGVVASNGAATIWFLPSSSVSYVDAHFSIANGAQQNLRMLKNAATGRYEVSTSLAQGNSMSYSFTYNVTGATQSDTPAYTYTAGASAKAATPVLSPAPGTYATALAVTLSTSTPGASIRYTLDGSNPTTTSPAYTGAITVGGSATLKAIAVAAGYETSDIAGGSYVISQAVASAPGFNPPAGTYASAQLVSMASATPGAQIRYTTDGSVPSGASTLYTSAINISASQTVRAIAIASGYASSAISAAGYTIEATGTGFVQGAYELGATATIWLKPNAPSAYAILHYGVNGGSQISPKMSFNSSLGRFEFVITPVRAGDQIKYFITYANGTGQLDTPNYTYTVGGASAVTKPSITPAGGTYANSQSVQLYTTEPNSVIRYTTDGSAPNGGSSLYVSPISVSMAKTINAITVKADGSQSGIASATYVIGQGDTAIATPSISHPGGDYGNPIAVNFLSATNGATIHYTLDGSSPTKDSPVYGGPVWVRSAATVKAVAIKGGLNSGVASASYTIGNGTGETWTGKTTFNMVNGTKGKWSDDKVFWAIIGKDWATGNFVHVDMNGNLVPMSLGDNGALAKNGLVYANYFFSLAQTKSITIPPINSARILMSVGEPMYIQVNSDGNGKIAYAGANIENPTDPNVDVLFDFGEFAILPPGSNPQGIFVNTTRVDQFGFPLKLNVTGLDGFDMTVGENLSESREEVFAKFITEVPDEFRGLAQAPYAPYRIMAPAHATFGKDAENEHYLDAYIDEVWSKYANEDLVMDLKNGWPVFTGRVVGNKFRFTDGVGTYYINGKPTTAMVMLGAGLLDDSTGTTDVGKQLQLQAQMCAALNRRVAHLSFDKWWHSPDFYPAGAAANYFTKFWHDHSLNSLAYGFAYDDVGGYSPSIHTEKPRSVTYTIGW
ncbi:chitobiase/beta-hexosaminidase C-terminal domain-containing protein [Niveibacterium sp. SC-1]|uniref:chitobiase/beta-hexosaminidase C-terminal domain-containing protein n=1 Tax=Niveibacterium sp. SC-1 TaxID=3135646 RepID=UPI00311D2E54